MTHPESSCLNTLSCITCTGRICVTRCRPNWKAHLRPKRCSHLMDANESGKVRVSKPRGLSPSSLIKDSLCCLTSAGGGLRPCTTFCVSIHLTKRTSTNKCRTSRFLACMCGCPSQSNHSATSAGEASRKRSSISRTLSCTGASNIPGCDFTRYQARTPNAEGSWAKAMVTICRRRARALNWRRSSLVSCS